LRNKLLHIALSLAMLSVKVFPSTAGDIKGTVVSQEKGNPLENVLVTLRKSKGGIIAFRQTDTNGTFAISWSGDYKDSLFLDFRLLGYETVRIKPPFDGDMTIHLKEDNIELPEVKVNAQKMEITGDTTRYYVQTLISQGDRVLGDILEKLPGISVSEDGYVRHKGLAISRMYIDSTDLLESRYNLATKNIDPRDIKSIEIYENHQHIKAIRGIITPQEAAINIILKDNAKAKWLATLSAEAGVAAESPWVPYSANAFAMNVGGKAQSINTAGTDASGNNITQSINPSLSAIIQNNKNFGQNYNPANYLSINHYFPPLDASRSRFNTSYSITSDNKFEIKNCLFGVAGRFEHEKMESSNSVRNIYNNDREEVMDFTEINAVNSTKYYGGVDLSAEINSRRQFINDKLRLEFQGTDVDDRLGGSQERLQTADSKDINFMNNLNMIFAAKNRNIFMISMFTQYRQKNENSTILNPEDSSRALQDIAGRYFRNNLRFSYAVQMGKHWTLSTETELRYLHRSFWTSLDGLSLGEDVTVPTHNDVKLQYVQPSENIYLEFKSGRFMASLDIDAWYQYLDCKMQEQSDKHSFAVNPMLRMEYRLGPKVTVNANASYTLKSINEQQLYDGLIMTNYKYFVQGRTELTQTPVWNAGLGLEYNEIAAGWVMNAAAQYSSSKDFQMTRYFIDDYIVNILSNNITDYSSVSANASISKTFLDIGSKITTDFSFSNTTSTINQDRTDYRYIGRIYNASISYNGTISTWMSINYTGTYEFNRYSTDGTWNNSGNHSSTHGLTMAFFPHNKIELSATVEYYLDKIDGRDLKQTVFLDAHARCAVTDKISIYLNAKNLLNSKTYTYSLLMPLQSVYYEFRIRPLIVLLGVDVRF